MEVRILKTSEKIKNFDAKKIILIVPERAAILGSSVSLKLLFSEIVKNGKYVIIVTKDEVGRKLARRSNLVAVSKVNEINKEKWEEVKRKIDDFVLKKKARVESLVGERKETLERVPYGGISKEEYSTTEAKSVNLDGFNLVVGGDISEFDVEDEKTGQKEGKQTEHSFDGLTSKTSSEKSKGLLGKDLSTYSFSSQRENLQKKSQVGGNLTSIGLKVENIINSIKNLFLSKGNKPKVAFIFLICLVVFLISSYFVFSKGTIKIRLESRSVNLEKQIIADTQVLVADFENLLIPCKYIEAQDDSSDTADATGTKLSGEYASGTVRIYNKTESEVVVVSGTVLEEIETGNKYKTTTDVTVPAKYTEDPDGPNPKEVIGNIEVGVKAMEFGSDYNIIGSQKKFKISGLSSDNFWAKNFNDIKGGTTEEIRVVSKEDKDNLRNSLVEKLQESLKEKIKENAGTSREVLLDTIEYNVIYEETSPDEGQKTEKFSMSITLKAKALSFSKDDIDELARRLVKEESKQEVEIEEFEYKSELVSTEGSKIVMNLSIRGIVTPSIGEEIIVSNIKGKSKSSAADYLNSLEEVKSYKIELSPSWIPSFIQRFPNSANRIKVDIEKVKSE